MTAEKQTPAEGLLPCPFCGGEAEFERMGTSRQSCIVVCGSCGARLESSDEYQRSGSRWNDRAALASASSNPVIKESEITEVDTAHYPLPDSLYPDSKDWQAADYAGRVEWLHVMYELAKGTVGMYEAQAAAVPAGWKLAPVEPTETMIDAGVDALSMDCDSTDAREAWADMLAAAPAAPVAPGGDDYKARYEEAMVASSEAGYVGMSPAETIRALVADSAPAPVAREPLTAAERIALWQKQPVCSNYGRMYFERGIVASEKAHGITPKEST